VKKTANIHQLENQLLCITVTVERYRKRNALTMTPSEVQQLGRMLYGAEDDMVRFVVHVLVYQLGE
jgi:hypothetical protein